jgi:excinuclease UvrABC nuclease subunit
MKTIYRLFDSDGVLLYVGCSLYPLTRVTHHHHHKKWFRRIASVTFGHYTNHDLARRVECSAIENERPRYNKYIGIRVERDRDGKYVEQTL